MELALLMHKASSGFAHDSYRARTNIMVGGITLKLAKPHRVSGPSLRVSLATLRATTRPVIPWYGPPFVHLGRDDVPPQHTRDVLQRLPEHVHELLGPHLQRKP
jgi:hypothetical protein